jgi:splicing suppressor protein 51
LAIFVKFLGLAETRQGIVPPWWSEEKKYECVNLATMNRDFNINHPVEKYDVQKQWRDDAIPA